MRKSIIVGLLCLAIFLAAYVGGMIVAIPQRIFCVVGTATKFVGFSALGISVCGGGDEGGGGTPGITTGDG